MEQILDLLYRVGGDVLTTVVHTWPFLVISIVAASATMVYIGTERVSVFLRKRQSVAVGVAVLVATLTPFCSCGTTAVLLGMMATTAPWAPLVAFVVASPLTSPSELIFSAGLFGWRFALVFFIGTIFLGILAGWFAGLLDRLGWLEGQARMEAIETGCAEPDQSCDVSTSSGDTALLVVSEQQTLRQRLRLADLGREILVVGRRLTVFFLAFTTLSYLLIEAIPTAWMTDYVGDDSILAVPLGALLGLPAYLNSEASLPMVAGLRDGGMGTGAAMAFIVTGAGTSVGAITGLLVIARARVVAIVVGSLFVGAIALGLAAQVIV